MNPLEDKNQAAKLVFSLALALCHASDGLLNLYEAPPPSAAGIRLLCGEAHQKLLYLNLLFYSWEAIRLTSVSATDYQRCSEHKYCLLAFF